MNEQFKKTAAIVALCGVIAFLSCLASDACGGILRAVITFIGDLAVLSLFSAMTRTLSRMFTKNRRAALCALDCVSLALKIAFSSLCALSGGVLLHAAALMVDCVFSRIYVDVTDPL